MIRYNTRMSAIFDLHSHSTVSDGSLSPADLVTRAASFGVNALALTDHDSTSGIQSAEETAMGLGLMLIPGVEISVTWSKQVVHIVGLNINVACPELQQGLSKLREYRAWRAEEIGRRLDAAGIPGAYEGACEFAKGDLIGRTHFAHFLVKGGYAKDTRKVFKHFLVSGKPGHVSGEWADLSEAVGWITAAGGQAVIAHPARYRMTRTKLRRLFAEFSEAGGVGLEVVSGSHSRDEGFTMARHASDWDFLSSAGSDFHGPEHSWTELGRLDPLPEQCVPIWHDWSVLDPSLSNTA